MNKYKLITGSEAESIYNKYQNLEYYAPEYTPERHGPYVIFALPDSTYLLAPSAFQHDMYGFVYYDREIMKSHIVNHKFPIPSDKRIFLDIYQEQVENFSENIEFFESILTKQIPQAVKIIEEKRYEELFFADSEVSKEY